MPPIVGFLESEEGRNLVNQALSRTGSDFQVPNASQQPEMPQQEMVQAQPVQPVVPTDLPQEFDPNIPYYLGSPIPKEEQQRMFLEGEEEDKRKLAQMQKETKELEAKLAGPPQDTGAVDPQDVFVPTVGAPSAPAMPQQAAMPVAMDVSAGAEDIYQRFAPDVVRGFQQQTEGLREQARAGQAAAAKEIGYRNQLAKEMAKNKTETEDIKAQWREEVEKIKTNYREGLEELSSYEPLTKTEAMSKWFSERSTPVKILAGIGFAISIAASATRSPIGRVGLGIFDGLFESEIDAQVKQIANKKAKLSGYINMLDMANDKFGDELAAKNAVRGWLSDMTANEVGKFAAMTDNAVKAGQLEALEGQLRQKTAAHLSDLQDSSFNQFLKRTQFGRSLRGVPAEGVTAKSFTPEQLADPDFDAEQLVKEDKERHIPARGLARTKSGAERFRKLDADISSGVQSIDRLIDISRVPFDSLNPVLRAEAQNIKQTLIGSLRLALVGPGAVSEFERKAMQEAIADPTSIFAIDPLARIRLNTLKNALENKLESGARAEGLKYDKTNELIRKLEKAK